MRASRLTTAVRTLPAINVAIRDAEHHSEVPRDGRIGCHAIEQPVRQRTVVEGLAEALGSLAQSGETRHRFTHDRPGIGPFGGVMATHPGVGSAVFVWVVPGEQEGDFDALSRGNRNRGGYRAIDGLVWRCGRARLSARQGSEAAFGGKGLPYLVSMRGSRQD